METVQVEVWVLVDEDGKAVASCDADTVASLYEDEVDADAGVPRRLIKVTLTVPKPVVQEMSGVVPPIGSGGTLTAE